MIDDGRKEDDNNEMNEGHHTNCKIYQKGKKGLLWLAQ
jgi:hypothetical protein